MSHIFISYSRDDIEFARYLKRLLEEHHFAVWIDESQLQPSTRWWRTIERNIDSAAAFVVIMSPSAYESDWVEREILRAEDQKRPIYPILYRGEAWSRLANIQFEDMRLGLRATLSAKFVSMLRHTVAQQQTTRTLDIRIEHGLLQTAAADVIVLKYAQHFYGADRAIAEQLVGKTGMKITSLMPEIGDYAFVETDAADIAAPHVLFVGVVELRDFDYEAMRKFSTDALRILAHEAPTTRHIAMTIHGPGAGRDEFESLRAQFAGYLDAMQSDAWPYAFETITIVEFNAARVQRLRAALDEELAAQAAAEKLDDGWGYHITVARDAESDGLDTVLDNAGAQADSRPYAYVVMPDSDDMDDIFYYGIQGATHAAGLLCERLGFERMPDDDTFDMIKQRIEAARVVIIEMSDANPTTYLQIGYALGCGAPTVLLIHEDHDAADYLHGYTCYAYKRIQDVEAILMTELNRLRDEGIL
ncbi:MAG: toll/interleukin-1 receptor domain-containing protein [Chloroflexi bacterium]|nr:MAG: toll/interleukin-1 receptor domain-containing protein [Chloroflexota bacterium]